jgi:hypothetical protein
MESERGQPQRVTVAERPPGGAYWGSPLLTPAERRAKAVLEEVFAREGALIFPGSSSAR